MRYGFAGMLANMPTKRATYKINAVSVVTSADMCQSICDTIICVQEECRVRIQNVTQLLKREPLRASVAAAKFDAYWSSLIMFNYFRAWFGGF